eukprot:c4722_g1_i1.p1 GENE.c4722_g1_i1~~c4722_g1_i1.p1  ORF type:complete len:402 (+),score=85.70 c4722_g1_i1:61-1266(+)
MLVLVVLVVSTISPLQKTILSLPNVILSPFVAVSPSEMSGAGLGVTATHDIEEGQHIISIPENLSICASSSIQVRVGTDGDFSSQVMSALDKKERLVVLLLDVKRDQHHPAHPMVVEYPEQFQTLPYLSTQQIELLQLETLKAIAEFEVQEFKESCARIMAALTASKRYNDVSLAEVRWALSIVQSRAFGDSDKICLHPVVDLVNMPRVFFPPASTGVKFEADGSVVLIAQRKIIQGEELTNSYGAHDNMNLLTKFGFAINANPFDNVCIHFTYFTDHCPKADPAKVFHKALNDEMAVCTEGGKFGKMKEVISQCCEASGCQQQQHECDVCTARLMRDVIFQFSQGAEATTPAEDHTALENASDAITKSLLLTRVTTKVVLTGLSLELEDFAAQVNKQMNQ